MKPVNRCPKHLYQISQVVCPIFPQPIKACEQHTVSNPACRDTQKIFRKNFPPS